MAGETRYTVAWRKLSTAIKKWEDGDGPTIDNRKAISQELSEAIETAINDTADQEIIGDSVKNHEITDDCLVSCLLFDQLAKAYRDFKRAACAAVSLSEIDVDGDQSLWRSIGALKELANTKYNDQPPPPIPALRIQGVGDEQIARMYGFFTEDNEPDLERVLSEEMKPGTYYDPKTWVHPAKRKRIAAARAQVALRSPRGREYVGSEEFGKTTPPSLEELVKMGAPAPQIAMLHKIDVEEAEEMLERHRLENPSPNALERPLEDQRLDRDSEAEADKMDAKRKK